MDFEQVLGIPLFACGIFLLGYAVFNLAAFSLSTTFSAPYSFLVAVSTGIVLVIFGLYLMKIISKKK